MSENNITVGISASPTTISKDPSYQVKMENEKQESSKTKDNKVKNYSIDKEELGKIKLLFLLIGYCGIVNWPTTTNCIQTVYATVYDYPQGATTMLLPYLICSTLFGLLRIPFKHIAVWAAYLGIFLLFVTNLAIPLIVQFGPVESGTALLHTIIAFVGIGVSLFNASVSSYAILMPVNFMGLYAAGNGLAGLLAFALWQFLIRVPYDSSNPDDIKQALWFYYGFNMVSVLALAFMFVYIAKKPWFKGSIQSFEETKHLKLEDEVQEKTKEASLNIAAVSKVGIRPLKQMIRKPLPFMLLSGLSFCITYSVFPNIGPYSWVGTYDNRSFLVGIYQVLDLIGRYIPNMGKKAILPVKYTAIAIFLRLVFIPIWIIMSLTSSGIATNFIFQIFLMICFATLSGYLTVVPMIWIPGGLKTLAERGYLGLISFMAVQLWLCIGIAISNVFIIAFGISPE